MKNNVLKYYVAAFYLCATFVTFAQPGDGSTGDPLEGADAPATPIDDYVWIMVAIGMVYVFLRIRALSHMKNANQV